MTGFENWKTPCKVKRENLVSLHLTGAACETVEIVDPWETPEYSQSMKIGTDLSIAKSIKIGKSDLIAIDCIDQSVEIDGTLVSFIDLSWFLPISSIYILYIGRYVCSSVHSKMKTDFKQTVKLLTIELQLRVEGSNSYHFLKNSFKQIWQILSFLQNQVEVKIKIENQNRRLVRRRPQVFSRFRPAALSK